MPQPRLIVLEFNELCPALLTEFMGRGWLPNFRRLYESSIIVTTDAGERYPYLEPWIQWPTVHTGLTYAEHGVFHLGDGDRLPHPGVGDILSAAGVRVGIFGSMNVHYRSINGYYLPDPWTRQPVTTPEWLTIAHETIARQVQESSRPEAGSLRTMARFGLFLLRHGLSGDTVGRIAGQLLRERLVPALRWRRPSVLDHIQYDLFRHLNRRFAVDFATLFCNSTAHYQHYFWRNFQPEQFTVPPPPTDHVSLTGAIRYGYESMDALIGKVLADYPKTVVVLCSALSQQPWSDTTKCTYRPKDFGTFLEFARVSVTDGVIKPVMAEEFHFDCRDVATAERAERRFQELYLADRPLMRVQREGSSLFLGCAITDPTLAQGEVRRQSDGASRPFGDLFHLVHSMRSGRHHPDGVLWLRTGHHRLVPGRRPLIDVAPTLLQFFGVAPPSYMSGTPIEEVRAESLLVPG
ncbi:MAG: hypothetical protein NZ700_05645 [Gemmataceae bacterium]|nr:hypothetical protein [Gemmataceae bacterium]MDW8265874.1 hypothetical protein [Gemmataceae bacterium]